MFRPDKEAEVVKRKMLDGVGSLSERQAIELAMPAYMLHLVLESLEKTGEHVIRADTMHQLNVATVLPIRKYSTNPFLVKRVAEQIQDNSRAILGDVGVVDDLRCLAVAIAQFTVKLVDEGLYTDQTSMAVLQSLAILSEVEHDGEMWGDVQTAPRTMGRMMKRARLMGYYNGLSGILHSSG